MISPARTSAERGAQHSPAEGQDFGKYRRELAPPRQRPHMLTGAMGQIWQNIGSTFSNRALSRATPPRCRGVGAIFTLLTMQPPNLRTRLCIAPRISEDFDELLPLRERWKNDLRVREKGPH